MRRDKARRRVKTWYPTRERTTQIELELDRLEESRTLRENEIGDFLVRVSAYIRHLSRQPAVSQAILRDWIWVGSQYRINHGVNQEVHQKAQKYLLFLEKMLPTIGDGKFEFLPELRWVTDSAVFDLSSDIADSEYDSFLSNSEVERIDERLKELQVSAHELSEGERIGVDHYIEMFADITSETYLPAISAMISQIMEETSPRSSIQHKAIACIRYVLESDDVVPDSLGYLGLVDDIYAIEKTCAEIEKRSTWEPLLQGFSLRWPFIDRLTFKEKGSAVRFSPFMKAITGKVLHAAEENIQKTCVIVPETAFSGILSSFILAINSLRNRIDQEEYESSRLVPGDDILFGDTNNIVKARYSGTMEREGQIYHFIELKKGGKTSVPEEILALSRMSPKPQKHLSSLDDFNEWRVSVAPSPMSYLVGKKFDLDDFPPDVLFVTRKTKLDAYLPHIRPMGCMIPELIGIRYITSTGTEEDWRGTTIAEPLLWACSDAMTARSLISSGDGVFNPKHIVFDGADLASEFEGLISVGDVDESVSRVAICNLHETEDIRHLISDGYEPWLIRDADVSLLSRPISEYTSPRKGLVSNFQQRQDMQAYTTSSKTYVKCEPLEDLYEKIKTLRISAKNIDEPILDLVIMSANRFVRRFTNSPLQFNDAEVDELVLLLQNVIQHSGLLADFNEDVAAFSDHLRNMIDEGLPVNPRQDGIAGLIQNSPTPDECVVLCSSTLAAESASERTKEHPILSRARWVSVAGLRQGPPCRHVIVPGWMERKTMREIRNNGYSRHIDYIFFSFEDDWDRRSKHGGRSLIKVLSTRMRRQWGGLANKFGATALPSVLTEPDTPEAETPPQFDEGVDDHSVDSRIVDVIREKATPTGQEDHSTKGQLITFETGEFIFLPPHGSVINLTKAFDSISVQDPETTARDAENIVSCHVGEVKRSDVLAFPEGNTADLLDSMVTKFLPNADETRRLSALWREALRDYLLRTGKDSNRLQVELEQAGLKRHPMTIKMWLAGDHVIAPMKYKNALEKIALVTNHLEFAERLEDACEAIEKVYRARTKAAEGILEHLSRVRLERQGGVASVDIDGHQIHYSLHRVLSIDAPIFVAPDEIGILRNISDF